TLVSKTNRTAIYLDIADDIASKPLRLELDIPVEIIHPALVQEVGREKPAVIVQVVHGRLVWLLPRPHLGVRGHQPTLPEIAGRAGGHDVLPRRRATATAGHDMVEGQVLMRAAILALETVPQED